MKRGFLGLKRGLWTLRKKNTREKDGKNELKQSRSSQTMLRLDQGMTWPALILLIRAPVLARLRDGLEEATFRRDLAS